MSRWNPCQDALILAIWLAMAAPLELSACITTTLSGPGCYLVDHSILGHDDLIPTIRRLVLRGRQEGHDFIDSERTFHFSDNWIRGQPSSPRILQIERMTLRGGQGEMVQQQQYLANNDDNGEDRDDTESVDDGTPLKGSEESEGLASSKWRFLAGGCQEFDLAIQHVDYGTTLAMYAWATDCTFRFKATKDSPAMYCFTDASIIECLWFPPANITGVQMNHTQREQDWYFVRWLLEGLDKGEGMPMRRHGIDFGLYWRFRPVGDYILGTNTNDDIELWLTGDGFMCLSRDGIDRAVIVKQGQIIEDVSRSMGEAEVRGIAELREMVAADDEGFEADFEVSRAKIIRRSDRLKAKSNLPSCSSSDDSEKGEDDTTSDPDWDAPGPVVKKEEEKSLLDMDSNSSDPTEGELLAECDDEFRRKYDALGTRPGEVAMPIGLDEPLTGDAIKRILGIGGLPEQAQPQQTYHPTDDKMGDTLLRPDTIVGAMQGETHTAQDDRGTASRDDHGEAGLISIQAAARAEQGQRDRTPKVHLGAKEHSFNHGLGRGNAEEQLGRTPKVDTQQKKTADVHRAEYEESQEQL